MAKRKAVATTTTTAVATTTTASKKKAHPSSICSPAKMVDAVQRAHGIATVAAKILGCTRRTIYNYIERYPEVALAYKEAREENVDVAENKQLQALNKGARWAIENWLFYSKEGRERGWLKRAEQAQDMNLLNAIQIVIPDNARDGDMATVNVTQAGDGGGSDGNDGSDVTRQYTYATTLEEARHQKRIAGLSKDGKGLTPRENESDWLNVDTIVDEQGGSTE